MEPERWQQINALLDAALDLPPAQRRAYLDVHCHDPEVQQEVLSLLDAHEQARSFLEAPAEDYAASLIPMADKLAADPLVGKRIDDYHILDVLGRGGMGIVYKAEDEALSRTVALKMIDPALARDEAFVRRFRAEARALARIDSRHIVRVHAMRQTETGLYIVMEYVDGGTLTDRLQDGPLSWSQARSLVEQMLTALEHAHSVGVIHRDIKPGNIMLTSTGVVKVTDFGLAKVRQTDAAATVTQGIAGTLFYMSPEQVKGSRDLDHRSDLYSMGMTIYQMLAGQLPFDRDAGEFTIMRAIVEEAFEPPTQYRAEIPSVVVDAVMKSLAKDPARRFQDATEMRAAFLAAGRPGYAGAEAPTVMEAAPYQPAQESVQKQKPAGLSRRTVMRAGLGALGLVIVVGSLFLIPGLIGGDGAEPEPTPAATTSLTVFTVPDGASVYAGDSLLGVTPLREALVALQGETLDLSFRKEGYASRDTTLPVEADVPVTLQGVRLAATGPDEPDVATVRVTSSPGGASVRVNNQRVGRTPVNDLRVPAGQAFTVEISKDGCEAWSRRYQDVPSSPINAELRCSEPGPGPTPVARGTLTLDMVPEGTLQVAGEDCQAGQACEVTAGSKTVTFTHTEHGSHQRTITVRQGQQTQRTLYLEQPVAVQVRDADTGSPIWATILVDGNQVGQTTDQVLRLGPGEHRIEVNRETYTVLTPRQTMTVEPGFEPKQREILVFQIRGQ